MKITKQQLRQIIKEEIRYLQEESDMGEKAIRTAWDLYGENRGAKPKDPHPGGTKKEDAACTKRNKIRQIKDLDQETC